MKLLSSIFLVVLTLMYSNAQAISDNIRMVGKEENGYSEPQYISHSSQYDWKDRFDINLIANPNIFPWSSKRLGSVFEKIFDDLANKEHIVVILEYPKRNYAEIVEDFEKNEINTNGLFATYYENIPYTKNQYIYPSFFENNVHFITSSRKIISLKTKDELKNYKGVYVAQDYFSSFVLKDFAKFGIQKVQDFAEAYKKLLTGEIDYVVASYYPSQIELYKLGIHDYVAYSSAPLWKMPMFFRVTPEMANHPRIAYLKKYLKSASYAKAKEESLKELMEIYKENTRGIVPPTYINMGQTENNIEETVINTDKETEQTINKKTTE